MTNLDEIFNQIQFSDKAEKSLEDFSNWIFGISIGICAILIFQIKDFNLSKYCFNKIFYISIVIFSMINSLLVGYNKYLILKRATMMGVQYGVLRKLAFFSKIKEKKPDEIAKEAELIFSKWSSEYNIIKKIGRIHNITLITTLITLVATGILILVTI